MSALVLALPSKGRLQEQALAFFADCGLGVVQDGGARGYAARIEALPGCEVRLVSASEIAAALYAGEAHMGVTGEDLLREASPALDGVTLARGLGFGRADLVVATPRAWIDVDVIADLAAVAAEHRARTGRRLRVATKYVNLARSFFAARGLDDYRLVESAGATEGAPAAGAAEAIVDITTTGATLAANGLKVLSDGVILRSQAQLAASAHAAWDAQALDALERLMFAVEARARAKKLRLLRGALGGFDPDALDALLAEHGARRAGGDPEGVVSLLCPTERVFVLARALQPFAPALSAFEADYVFDGDRNEIDRLRRDLLAKRAPAPRT